MVGGLESRCVGRVYSADGAVRLGAGNYETTQHLMLLIMGVCARIMSSYEYINKIILLHQFGISHYFKRKMHGQRTLKIP